VGQGASESRGGPWKKGIRKQAKENFKHLFSPMVECEKKKELDLKESLSGPQKKKKSYTIKLYLRQKKSENMRRAHIRRRNKKCVKMNKNCRK